MTWRARLATIRAAQGNADSAAGADCLFQGDAIAPNGAIGANDFGRHAQKAGAVVARIQTEVLMALVAPEPELEAERVLMALHYSAPAAPEPWQPGDPDPLREGLLAGFRRSSGHLIGELPWPRRE